MGPLCIDLMQPGTEGTELNIGPTHDTGGTIDIGEEPSPTTS